MRREGVKICFVIVGHVCTVFDMCLIKSVRFDKNQILVIYILKMTTSIRLISFRSTQWKYSRPILIENLF